MGGGRPRASTSGRADAHTLFRHSCAGRNHAPHSRAPIRHSCAGRNPPPAMTPRPTPLTLTPIHSSPSSVTPAPLPVIPAPSPRHSCAGRNPPRPHPSLPRPSSSFLRRQEPTARADPDHPHHFPPIIPSPPLRHSSNPHPSFPRLSSVIPAQAGTHRAPIRHSRAPSPVIPAQAGTQLPPTVLPYPQKNESANNTHLPNHPPTPHPRRDHPPRSLPEQT